MRNLILLSLLAATAAATALAQGTVPGSLGPLSPDCAVVLPTTTTTVTKQYDNRLTGCSTWSLFYAASTSTVAVTIKIQSANDAGGIPDTWSDLATGSNFSGFLAINTVAPWLRINVSTLTTGAVSAVLMGWRPQSVSLQTLVGSTPVALATATAATDTTLPLSGVLVAEKSARWSVVSVPVAGTQASASRAAGGAGVRHVVDCVSFAAESTTAPALTGENVAIRDGATGAGTIIWEWILAVSAQTGQDIAPHSICGLNLIGTANTAMTFEFSAGVGNVIESVSMSGYDVQ